MSGYQVVYLDKEIAGQNNQICPKCLGWMSVVVAQGKPMYWCRKCKKAHAVGFDVKVEVSAPKGMILP
jgi:tRNA(Ile2) C34 agmatinyltransferase TiaS